MNYDYNRLKKLASLCIEKDITTNNRVRIRYSGVLKNEVSSSDFRAFEIEIHRNRDKKRRVYFEFYFYSTGEVLSPSWQKDYPIDRVISFIAGLK